MDGYIDLHYGKTRNAPNLSFKESSLCVFNHSKHKPPQGGVVIQTNNRGGR